MLQISSFFTSYVQFSIMKPYVSEIAHLSCISVLSVFISVLKLIIYTTIQPGHYQQLSATSNKIKQQKDS